MFVEGLLTYKIVDAEKTVRNIGVDKVVENIQNITKAEMSKLFSAIHLEQISSITYDEVKKPKTIKKQYSRCKWSNKQQKCYEIENM